MVGRNMILFEVVKSWSHGADPFLRWLQLEVMQRGFAVCVLLPLRSQVSANHGIGPTALIARE